MVVFVCEDSPEGIFTGVYDAWSSRLGHENVRLEVQGEYNYSLFSEYREVAVDQLKDYLENGNIRNSVNFPSVSMERSGVMRMCIIHKNVPAMLANITTLLSKDGVNVENLSNKSKGDYAYTMVDLGSKVADDVIEDVKHLPNVIRVRVIE